MRFTTSSAVKRLPFFRPIRPPIGKPLAFDAFHDAIDAHLVGPAKTDAVRIAEIEFGEIAV